MRPWHAVYLGVLLPLSVNTTVCWCAEPAPVVVSSPVKNVQTLELNRSALTQRDPVLRARAVQVLGRAGQPEDAPRIRAACLDQEASVRRAALSAVADLQLPLSESTMAALTADADARVRADWARVLSGMDAGDARPCLLPLLHDAQATVRRAAACSAAELGAVDMLAAAWSSEPDVEVKEALLQGLLNAPHESMRSEWLLKALSSEEPALLRTGLLHLRPGDQTTATVACIGKTLKQLQPVLQEAAIQAAAVCVDPSYLPHLKNLLNSDDPGLRSAVIPALVAQGASENVSALHERLRIEQNAWVCRALMDGLRAAHGAETPSFLSGLLTSEYPGHRYMALRLLAEWGDVDAIPDVFALLGDADLSVQTAAVACRRAQQRSLSVEERELLRALVRSDRQPPAVEALKLLGEQLDPERLALSLEVLNIQALDGGPELRVEAFRILTQAKALEGLAPALKFAAHRVIPPSGGAADWRYDTVEVRIEALHLISTVGNSDTARRLLEEMSKDLAPAAMRPALANALTSLTGVSYLAMPDRPYRESFLESLAPPEYAPFPPAPGIRPLSDFD